MRNNDSREEIKISMRKGKTRDVKLYIDGETLSIPVDEVLFTHFNNQFKRNTDGQKARHTTLMNLMKAAYQYGVFRGLQASKKDQ